MGKVLPDPLFLSLWFPPGSEPCVGGPGWPRQGCYAPAWWNRAMLRPVLAVCLLWETDRSPLFCTATSTPKSDGSHTHLSVGSVFYLTATQSMLRRLHSSTGPSFNLHTQPFRGCLSASQAQPAESPTGEAGASVRSRPRARRDLVAQSWASFILALIGKLQGRWTQSHLLC